MSALQSYRRVIFATKCLCNCSELSILLLPLMYFENKIFLLSKKQVDAIKGTTQNTTVLKVLDRIAHAEPDIERPKSETCKKSVNFNSSPDRWNNEHLRQ